MKSKQPSSDRGFGQRSIPSSFQFKSLSGDSNKEERQIKPSKKNNPSISLSDFLNRKLGRNSIRPKTVQNKPKPFSSLLIVTGSVEEQVGTKRGRGAAEVDPVLDETVFKQFNHPKREKEEYGELGGAAGAEEVTTTPNEHDLVEQGNPFRVSSLGGGVRDTALKHVVVLGDDPKPKQKRKQENFIRNKKPRPFFNHYANGSGWWDCDMAGVDNEEVGCSEVWEGMGSTTLGGLEWH